MRILLVSQMYPGPGTPDLGSFVATLFEPGRIQLEADLIEAGETATELYAKMGSPLGRLA